MSSFRPLPLSFYRRPAEVVARDLLGRYLVRELSGQRMVVRIVETEAYLGASDRASHAWNGRRTPRNESLYLPAGHAYVYFIYGKHFCLNAVAGESGGGGAVLLRAAEAVAGGELLREHRGLERHPRRGELAGGPGKLAQALKVDRDLDGHRLIVTPLFFTRGEPVREGEIATGPRVGIDYAGEAVAWPLRFAIRDHPEVSRPKITSAF